MKKKSPLKCCILICCLFFIVESSFAAVFSDPDAKGELERLDYVAYYIGDESSPTVIDNIINEFIATPADYDTNDDIIYNGAGDSYLVPDRSVNHMNTSFHNAVSKKGSYAGSISSTPAAVQYSAMISTDANNSAVVQVLDMYDTEAPEKISNNLVAGSKSTTAGADCTSVVEP